MSAGESYIVETVERGRAKCPKCGRWNVLAEMPYCYIDYRDGAYRFVLWTYCVRCESELSITLKTKKLEIER